MTSWCYQDDPLVHNLASLIEARMKDRSKIFITDGEGRDFSYADFWSLAGQFANVFAQNGVRRGDRVAVQVEKSVEALALFGACARLGAAYLPLNTAYTAAELEYFITDAEPSLIVCAPDRAEAVNRIAAENGAPAVLTLDGFGGGSFTDQAHGKPRTFTNARTGWNDMAAILYTSGTTGRSKGAVLTHGNLASNALALGEIWKFTENDCLLHVLPVYHTHGLFTATNTVLLTGGAMIFLAKFDAGEVIARLPEATTMMGVPTFYTRLLKQPQFTQELTAHMRLFVSGSAPLLAETHQRFFERTGHHILERYGMTETSMNTSNPYDGERRAGTVGFPLPGVDLRITNPENGNSLPAGETGMIEIRGPNVFSNYWRMPEKTAEELQADGYFITGDLGIIDKEGYLAIVGREKDLIISGGFNVYPKEIETEIDLIDGIAESAVFGVGHPDFGEGVTAVVVPDPAHPTPDQSDILTVLKTRLASFKLPKKIIRVEALPRNAMGKVQKNRLRQTYADLYAE